MLKELGRVKNFFLDILFPKSCAGCGREGSYVCRDCSVFLGEAQLICPVCEKPSFGGKSHEHCSSRGGSRANSSLPPRYNLEGLVGIWEYEGVTKTLIHKIKYGRVSDAIAEFLQISADAMTGDPSCFAAFFNFIADQKPAVTFVPMHIEKERERGFNQAELIAREFGRITSLKVIPLLKKDRETESQEKLVREKRLGNVKGVFSFGGLPRRVPQALLRGREGIPENLILIDDVWTTGATMKECLGVLKKAGAKKVWGFTLARVV